VERGVEIRSVRLLSKSGGKSGDWVRHDPPVVGEPRSESARSGARPGARAAGRVRPKTKPQRA